jgi:hypothetical protein
MTSARRQQWIWGIAISSFVFALIGFWILLTPANPVTDIFRAPVSDMGKPVITGPYPVREDFEELSQHGVGVDVSLLDPKIPYERVLLDQERMNARRYGMRFFDFPMASILGQKLGTDYYCEATHAANTIDSLRRRDKVYLHCYLGEHRMVTVKKMLAARGALSGFVTASIDGQ